MKFRDKKGTPQILRDKEHRLCFQLPMRPGALRFPSWEFHGLRIQSQNSSCQPSQFPEHTMQFHGSMAVFVVSYPSRISSPFSFACLTHNHSLSLSQGVIKSGAFPKFLLLAPMSPWLTVGLIYHIMLKLPVQVSISFTRQTEKGKAVILQWRNQTPPYNQVIRVMAPVTGKTETCSPS